MKFLSNESIVRHKAYLHERKLLLSVLYKSSPEICGKGGVEIMRSKRTLKYGEEALELISEIELHELYFRSFSDLLAPSLPVRERFGSEANFLYELEMLSRAERCGFLLVYADSKNKLSFCIENGYEILFSKIKPLLAIDLWEHAYFYDYGFDRKKYLKSALASLDFGKINDFYKSS